MRRTIKLASKSGFPLNIQCGRVLFKDQILKHSLLNPHLPKEDIGGFYLRPGLYYDYTFQNFKKSKIKSKKFLIPITRHRKARKDKIYPT